MINIFIEGIFSDIGDFYFKKRCVQKKLLILLKIALPTILETTGNNDMRRKFSTSSKFPFLKMGIILATFNTSC